MYVHVHFLIEMSFGIHNKCLQIVLVIKRALKITMNNICFFSEVLMYIFIPRFQYFELLSVEFILLTLDVSKGILTPSSRPCFYQL